MEEHLEERISDIWEISRANWHLPQLPSPVIGEPNSGQFPFKNYLITVDVQTLENEDSYLENLFDHLIVHYLFCPRSLETAASLALFALRSLRCKDEVTARRMVNIFTDIVVDSFRLEMSEDDRKKVLLGWKRLCKMDLSPLDKTIVSFLAEYWGVDLPLNGSEEARLLLQIFSSGIRDKNLWPRQCGQMARVLEGLAPGILGRGRVPALEILRGNAASAPIHGLAMELEQPEYEKALQVIGLKGDLKRWYRDQGYSLEIRPCKAARWSGYPSSPAKWRLSDPPSELDVGYSLSMSPRMIPGISTYKREQEIGKLSPISSKVPDLLVVLDSSRSMDGHSRGTKTFNATLAAFKACHFAHSQGAEVAAVNFSNTFLAESWTRDLNAIEDVLVEYLGGRTHIPGRAVLDLARLRPGCLILCITDTHIQNLYWEGAAIEEAAKLSHFALFCINREGRDKQVEETLRGLGEVYYIDSPEDLVGLIVETTERSYGT